jgi:hypothetical protein
MIAVILALAITAYFARRAYISRRARQMQGQEMTSDGFRGPALGGLSGPLGQSESAVVVGQIVYPHS